MVLIVLLVGIPILLAFIFPDETYIKMKEIEDNQTLIGLSKEQVVELLGKWNSK